MSVANERFQVGRTKVDQDQVGTIVNKAPDGVWSATTEVQGCKTQLVFEHFDQAFAVMQGL